MKNARRITCLVVAICMLVLTFVGCGKAKDDPTTSTTEQSTAVESSAPGSTAVSTDPITLKMYAKYGWWSRKGDLLTKSLAGLEITKLTGITLDVETPTGDENQKLNVMLAANEYPDMMLLDRDATLKKYIESGAIIPIDDLIEQYGPDVKKEVTLDYLKIFRNVFKNDDKLYFLPNQYATDPQVFQGTGEGYAIRENIYNEIGKPEIKTTDDLYNVLKTIQAKNIKVNGKDLIPVEISGFTYLLSGIFGTNSVGPNGDFSCTPDGTAIHLVNDPKMKEGFKYANKLYREKLIDQEEFTQGGDTGTEKANNGRYAVFGHTNAYGWIKDVINAQLEKTVQDKYVLLDTPLAPGVEKAQLTYTGLKGWNVICITMNCEAPERAMQLMNLLSSEKGQIMSRLGPEGTVWTMEDGKPKLTQKYADLAKTDRDSFNKEVGYDMWNWLGNKKYDYAFDALNTDAAGQAENERMAKICLDSSWYLPGIDGVIIDPKSKEGLALTKISDYFSLQQKKLIMTQSDAEFEAKYSEMQAKVDELGVKIVEAEVTKQMQAGIAALK